MDRNCSGSNPENLVFYNKMNLCIFFSFALQAKLSSIHSLAPPYIFTNFSEIESWSIVGSAVNLKSYLRLTNLVTNDFGGVCNRIPTNFDNWSVTLEMASLKGNCGDSYHLYFTKEFCPKIGEDFAGFKILINMTQGVKKSEFASLYFIKGTKVRKIGDIRLSGTAVQLEKLHVEKRGNIVGIQVIGNYRKHFYDIRLDNDNNDNKSYYFSFYANTNEKYTDENNLISVTTIALSDMKDNENKTEYYSTLNRKIIQNNVYQRKELKKQRRSKMILTNRYNEEIQKNENILNGKNVNLKDSFEIIKESYDRSNTTITSDYLYDYFTNKIGKATHNAIVTVNLVSERLGEIKKELNSIWIDLNEQLQSLKRDSMSLKNTISDESIDFAKRINLKSLDKKQQKDRINHIFNNESKISKVIFIICSIEFILYAFFFIYKHKQTKGFKKID